VFSWNDYDTGGWEQWIEEITVLGNGQGGALVVATGNSGCIDPNPVPDPHVELGSWGRVKSLYR
jgi:hypothetical protein